jgi:hypothetical protein
MKEQRVLLCPLLQTSLFPLLVKAEYLQVARTSCKNPASFVSLYKAQRSVLALFQVSNIMKYNAGD